jgi:hypothetical protein
MQKMLCRSPKGVMMRSEAEIGAWPCDETEIRMTRSGMMSQSIYSRVHWKCEGTNEMRTRGCDGAGMAKRLE